MRSAAVWIHSIHLYLGRGSGLSLLDADVPKSQTFDSSAARQCVDDTNNQSCADFQNMAPTSCDSVNCLIFGL